eukprot:140472-Hanusia_phi.AAC.4
MPGRIGSNILIRRGTIESKGGWGTIVNGWRASASSDGHGGGKNRAMGEGERQGRRPRQG